MIRAALLGILKLTVGAIFLLAAYVFGLKVGMWGANNEFLRDWPNWPGCQLAAGSRYPSEGGTDTATILKRSCGGGENIKYFVRLDIAARHPDYGAWRAFIELENDQRPLDDPTVVWIAKGIVQITVSTRTLSGTLIENRGEDIKIIRVYKPREPGALPNWPS